MKVTDGVAKSSKRSYDTGMLLEMMKFSKSSYDTSMLLEKMRFSIYQTPVNGAITHLAIN